MKLTTKLLIIALLATSFFIPERNTVQTDVCFTIAANPNEESDYNEQYNDITRPYSLDTTTTM